jgi:catechol 2,3-dioxygenase-like lactoylglutathione lyase family enzyme
LNISKIDHVSLNVRDMEKSLDFYGRVLGLKQLETVDCGDFDITYFGLPDGSRLELFDYHGKNHTALRQESEVGLRHIALQVKDVAAHERLLRAEGVEIAVPTCDLPNLGVRVMLFLDPNGACLELCERL